MEYATVREAHDCLYCVIWDSKIAYIGHREQMLAECYAIISAPEQTPCHYCHALCSL